jgi:hypothetical protein
MSTTTTTTIKPFIPKQVGCKMSVNRNLDDAMECFLGEMML